MTTTWDIVVDDVEETLFALGQVGLYEFSQIVRGADKSLSEDEVLEVCREAYAHLTSRFALHLEWFDWPPREGRPAEPDAPVTFDTHRDFESTELEVPFLALVPDDPDAVGDELERQFFPQGRPAPAAKKHWWSR